MMSLVSSHHSFLDDVCIVLQYIFLCLCFKCHVCSYFGMLYTLPAQIKLWQGEKRVCGWKGLRCVRRCCSFASVLPVPQWSVTLIPTLLMGCCQKWPAQLSKPARSHLIITDISYTHTHTPSWKSRSGS